MSKKIGYNDLVNLSVEELHDLNHQIVEVLRLKQSELVRNFRVGDKVQFEHRGRVIEGVVRKVNRKTVAVTTDLGGFKCSPSLLTAI